MYVLQNKLEKKAFKMKGKAFFAFGIMLVFVSVNCSAQSSTNDQRIVGTWVATDDETYVFSANGSGTHTDSDGNKSFTYGISNDGVINMMGDYKEQFKIFFSPDGRTLIVGNRDIYRKR
jgi:hypothetical protein